MMMFGFVFLAGSGAKKTPLAKQISNDAEEKTW